MEQYCITWPQTHNSTLAVTSYFTSPSLSPSGLKAHANQNIYILAIHHFRDTCNTCIQHTPTPPKEPIILSQFSPQPQWLFQMICGDYFTITGHAYMAIVNWYSGWLCIYHFGSGNATSIELRTLFITYVATEEFSSDVDQNSHQIYFSNFSLTRVSNITFHQENTLSQMAELSLV